jgi:MFS family permease
MRVCLLASAALAAVVPLAPNAWLLVPTAAGADGAAAGLHPLLQDLLCDAVPDDAEPAVLGLAASAVRFGSLGGSALAPLIGALGAPFALVGAAVVLAACAAGLRPLTAPTPPVPG